MAGQITEAIAMGKMVRKGSSAKMDKFISTLFTDMTSVVDDEECKLD